MACEWAAWGKYASFRRMVSAGNASYERVRRCVSIAEIRACSLVEIC